ncbi:MAG: hypothetical protein ACRENA_06315 [Vulcanimicrobiaceae bacterium]
MRGILIFISFILTSGGVSSAQTPELKHWVIQPPASGIYTGIGGGERSNEGSCSDVSRAVGQTMQFCDRQYTINNLPEILSDGKTTPLSAAGTIPVVSLGCNGNGTPAGGGRVTFAAIAAGSEDAALRRDAAALKAYAAQFPETPWLMIRPFHEFNENIGNPRGHPNKNNCYSMPESVAQMQQEFIAAYRHVVTYLVAQGATHVTWLWCPAVGPATWRRFGGDELLRGFYPGDAYVDWTCADTYDKAPGGGGFNYTFQHVGFFKQFHKPLIIAETAECNSESRSRHCQAYTQTQAQFISDLGRALQPGGSLADVGIKAWLYFDQDVPTSGYNWSFDSAGLNAFRALINTPYFHPSMPRPHLQ